MSHDTDLVYSEERAKIEEGIAFYRQKISEQESQLIDLETAKREAEYNIRQLENKERSIRPNRRAWSIFAGVVANRGKNKVIKERAKWVSIDNELSHRILDHKNKIRDRQESIQKLQQKIIELGRQKRDYEREAYPRGGGRGGESREPQPPMRELDRPLGRDPEGLRPARRENIHPAAEGRFTEAGRDFDYDGVNPHPLLYRGPEDPRYKDPNDRSNAIRDAFRAQSPEERERQLPGYNVLMRDDLTREPEETREPEPNENRETEELRGSNENREQAEPENREQPEKYWRDDLKEKIDQAREESRNMDEFRENLSRQGIQTNLRGNGIISFLHPGVQTNIRGTTLGEEYSRESLERDFAEREREDQDIERDIGDTNRGDERDSNEREQYEYKADHPFARMCEAGARLRENPTPEHEREFFEQKAAWKEYADTRMEELKAERDGDSRASRETERDNSSRDDRDNQPELDRDQPEPDIDDRDGDDRGDDR